MQQLKTFFALILLAFSSCHTVKRACKTLDANPTDRARYCAANYKPVEKTKTTVKYLPGKPIRTNSVEYVTVDCDSVVKAAKAAKTTGIPGKIVKVPVPVYIQPDTVAILLETERENVAALAYKDAQKDSLNILRIAAHREAGEMEDKRDWWRIRAIGTWTAILALLALYLGYRYVANQYKR